MFFKNSFFSRSVLTFFGPKDSLSDIACWKFNKELLHKKWFFFFTLYTLKLFIIETDKSLHHINAECLRDLFKSNYLIYYASSQKFIPPKRKTTSNRLRSFSYLGSKLWNDLGNLEPAMANIEFDELIEFLTDCEGPDTNVPLCLIYALSNICVHLTYNVLSLS